MSVVFSMIIAVAAVGLAAVAAYVGVRGLTDLLATPTGRVRLRVRSLGKDVDVAPEDYGRARHLVSMAASTSTGFLRGATEFAARFVPMLDRAGVGRDGSRISRAGLRTILDAKDMLRVRAGFGLLLFVLLFVLMLAGGIGGALVLGLVGFALGVRLPSFALARAADERSQAVVRLLPEMIDMIALASRAGMSFDAALSAYCKRFDTPLAHDMGAALEQWRVGAVTREASLEGLAAELDIDVFARFTAAVLQALRLGAPLAKVLEEQAIDARKAQRLSLEEEIAKAPVKILLPMGGLILPAMLLLMLGPVVLGVVGGLSGGF